MWTSARQPTSFTVPTRVCLPHPSSRRGIFLVSVYGSPCPRLYPPATWWDVRRDSGRSWCKYPTTWVRDWHHSRPTTVVRAEEKSRAGTDCPRCVGPTREGVTDPQCRLPTGPGERSSAPFRHHTRHQVSRGLNSDVGTSRERGRGTATEGREGPQITSRKGVIRCAGLRDEVEVKGPGGPGSATKGSHQVPQRTGRAKSCDARLRGRLYPLQTQGRGTQTRPSTERTSVTPYRLHCDTLQATTSSHTVSLWTRVSTV